MDSTVNVSGVYYQSRATRIYTITPGANVEGWYVDIVKDLKSRRY